MKIIFAVLLTFGAFSLFACGRNNVGFSGDHSVMPEQKIENFTITEMRGGKVIIVIESEGAVINDTSTKAFVRHPRVRFFQDGVYTSTLVGEKAILNLENYNLRGVGKAVMNTVDGERLESYNLFYNAQTQKVSSEYFVRLTRENETVTGVGFDADTALENVNIRSPKIILENVSR
ncbi:MAG: LPS export ABC transporter periplasmic protein LptC [Elusimicrobia bacterium]|nr:LPS export ABC transporter periplasmic protein LptC [Elusimicrobiota bacterium]